MATRRSARWQRGDLSLELQDPAPAAAPANKSPFDLADVESPSSFWPSGQLSWGEHGPLSGPLLPPSARGVGGMNAGVPGSAPRGGAAAAAAAAAAVGAPSRPFGGVAAPPQHAVAASAAAAAAAAPAPVPAKGPAVGLRPVTRAAAASGPAGRFQTFAPAQRGVASATSGDLDNDMGEEDEEYPDQGSSVQSGGGSQSRSRSPARSSDWGDSLKRPHDSPRTRGTSKMASKIRKSGRGSTARFRDPDDRKVKKNEREKQRRLQVNQKFDELAALVTDDRSLKADKITVLADAVSLIKSLQREVRMLQEHRPVKRSPVMAARRLPAAASSGDGSVSDVQAVPMPRAAPRPNAARHHHSNSESALAGDAVDAVVAQAQQYLLAPDGSGAGAGSGSGAGAMAAPPPAAAMAPPVGPGRAVAAPPPAERVRLAPPPPPPASTPRPDMPRPHPNSAAGRALSAGRPSPGPSPSSTHDPNRFSFSGMYSTGVPMPNTPTMLSSLFDGFASGSSLDRIL